MLTNDPDGIAASDPVHGLPATIKSHGFDVHYLGLYPPLSDDFTAQITQLKNINADIACGIFNPPQFAIFWTQCAQQGFKPKIVTPPKALLFPTAVEALGDRGAGMSTEVWWSHHHPFKSGLTGQTAQQYCDAYEKASGKQWTQPLGFKHANLEVAIDVLKRAKKLNAASIRDAIAADQLPINRWSDHLEGRPVEPGAECVHDANCRRAVGKGHEVEIRPQHRLQRQRPANSGRPAVLGDFLFLTASDEVKARQTKNGRRAGYAVARATKNRSWQTFSSFRRSPSITVRSKP